MKSLARLTALNPRLGWVVVLLFACTAALFSAAIDNKMKQSRRLSQLSTEAQRSSIEIMSTTLNGNLMGSITLLGFMDGDIKQEAINGLPSVDANIPMTVSIVGNAFGAEGVFIVAQDGIVKTSWDRANKPSTGLDVSFRPYFKMAMRGQSNVYAAVSMARGDRSLYFSAPIFAERAKSNHGIGAVVARTNLKQVDQLLQGKFDIAILLSPQGVVFASSQPEWLGFIEGTPTAQRLKDIRDLKQFGSMFEKTEPKVLPFTSQSTLQSVLNKHFAVASAPVKWNDPSGDWTLLVLEDVSRSAPWSDSLALASTVLVLTGLIGWMLLHLLRGQYAQAQANQQLQEFSQLQQRQVAFRAHLAALSIQLQRCHDMTELVHTFLQESRELLGTLQGVVYIVNAQQDPPTLRLAGAAACASPPPDCLALGETLLGQCALERRLHVITTVPDGYWTIRSGLGNMQPAALLLAPLTMHNNLLGVLELALRQCPDVQAQAQLTESLNLLATSMEILSNNQQLRQFTHIRNTTEEVQA